MQALTWFPKTGQLSRLMQQWQGVVSQCDQGIFVSLGAGVRVEVPQDHSDLASAVLFVRDLHHSQGRGEAELRALESRAGGIGGLADGVALGFGEMIFCGANGGDSDPVGGLVQFNSFVAPVPGHPNI